MAHATDIWEEKWIKAMFGGDFTDIATGATKTVTSFEVGLLLNADAGGTVLCPNEQTELEDQSVVTEPNASDNYLRSNQTLLNDVSVGGIAGGFKFGASPDTIVNTDPILFSEAGGSDFVPASGLGWGDVNYIGLWAVGGPLAGQLVAYVPIDASPLTVDAGNQVNIPAETLLLRLS